MQKNSFSQPIDIHENTQKLSPSSAEYGGEEFDSKIILKLANIKLTFINLSTEDFHSFSDIINTLSKNLENNDKPKIIPLEIKGESQFKVQIGYYTDFSQLLAIKFLTLKQNEFKEKQLLSFLSEIKKMEEIKMLKSESFVNIVKYFPEFNKSKNELISINIAMDEAEFSLWDYVFSVKKLAEKLELFEKTDIYYNILIMMSQVLKGLKVLHGAGYLFGDIKLDNLLIFRKKDKYSIKISDFGTLLKYTHYNEKHGLLGWTQSYVPSCFSEQKHQHYNGQNLNEEEFYKVDIYCLQITFQKIIKNLKKIFNKNKNENERKV